MRRILPTMHGKIARRDERGLSLMEALIVIFVMALLMTVLVQIFALNYRVYLTQSARVDADNGAIFAARNISNDARGASEVIASRTINGTAYASDSDELILKLPSYDAAGDIIDGEFDYIAIAKDPGDATRVISDTELGTGSARHSGARLISAYNDALRFIYNAPTITDASRVSAYIKNQQTVRSTTLTTEAWTSLVLRNKY